MTGEEKAKIQTMRQQGVDYSRIAEALGLSINTVKSFCRRNNLCDRDIDILMSGSGIRPAICKQCGNMLEQKSVSRPRLFCCESCRRAWWKEHGALSERKAFYPCVCGRCGKEFKSYGNKRRKFCSHSCYIKYRFGEEAHHDERAV